MSENKKYKLNPDTLLYEIDKVSVKARLAKGLGMFLVSLVLSALYFFIYVAVLDLELPKTVLLKKANETWKSRIEVMDRQLDTYEETLDGLEVRDESVYRNVFGMNSISPEVRHAGFGGVNRYGYLDNISDNTLLKGTTIRLDVLTKRAYVQSKSFDEIAAISKRAGDIASCIPAVSPVNTDKSKYRLSSSFGYRTDPKRGHRAFHSGMDFAMKPGNPVYASGGGVVEEVKFELFGYGHSVLIDHGFGYKTRYAHMNAIYVAEGMKVRRGECLGESGNTGKSTGPHLHYEVWYKGKAMNPYNYLDLEMPKEEYASMVEKAAAESPNVLVKPHTKIKIR